MTLPRVKFATVEEYLSFEDASLEKHEYYKGEIFAMAGASFAHNQIVSNTILEIGTHLRNKSCQVLASDLKIHIEANSLFTYPDVVVLCDPPQFHEDRTDTVINPTVIIEVLSPSTRDYDRGGKFTLYREIPSLKEYVLISSTEYHFEKFVRQTAGTWIFTESKEPEQDITIDTIQFSLPLLEFYRNVDGIATLSH